MLYTHAAAVLAGLAIGATGAWHVQGWRWRAADADRLEFEREARRGQEIRTNSAAERYETQRAAGQAAARVIVREVERLIERPVYKEVCLDADGLSAINGALHPREAADEE